MTEGQARGHTDGWPRFGVQVDAGPLDWEAAFGRGGRRVFEIGFGMGDSLLAMAVADPDACFVGAEVHKPGVGRLLGQALERGVDNIRVYQDDAVVVLRECMAPASIDTIQVFFPDPWHKKRHHKRRLIQPGFAALAASRLRPGGVLHLATDWEPYAEHMLAVLDAESTLTNCAGPGATVPRPPQRPETKFERRGARLGHGVWDLLYRRSDESLSRESD